MHPWGGWHPYVSPCGRCYAAWTQQNAHVAWTRHDVVGLAASAQGLDLVEFWMVVEKFRIFATHETAKVYCPNKCPALPMFRAFSCLHVVQFFSLEAKARELHGTLTCNWKAYNKMHLAFCTLAARPTPQNIQEWFRSLERVVYSFAIWLIQ